jgi:serine/threonine protein kinase
MTGTSMDATLIDGRYRLEVELGAGAFGSVYKATQVVLDRPMREVALKLFRGESIRPDNVERMMNDAIQIQAVLAQLTDWEVRQHFVAVYDLGITHETQPRGYVAMELVRGGSLEGRLHDGRKFTLHGGLHYLLQIARALAYMHQAGFVHSDLKPANVLVFRGRESDLVKIGDFGLSGKYVGPFADGPRGGTLSYLASEALAGFATTPGCDVFSLGVLAYELLKGGNPYDRVGSTLDTESPDYHARLNDMHWMSRETPLRLRREDYPELAGLGPAAASLAALLDVVNLMLENDLSRRYVSAQGVYRDLERIAAGRLPDLTPGDPTEATCQAKAVPALPETTSAAADPLSGLIEQFEYHLVKQDWFAASQTASEVVKAVPQRALGYQLKSRISGQQAGLEANGDSARQLRKQAIQVLQRGLNQCSAANERRELRQSIAELYEELGEYEAARQIRNLRT